MRRAPLLAVSGAVAGFAGLIGWHSVAAAPAVAPQAGAPGPAGPAGKAAPAGTGTPTGSAGSAGSAARHRHAGRQSAARRHAAAGGAAQAVRSATGSLVNFGYGTIAVRITVRGNSIIAASVSTLTTLEPTSQQISDQAIPVLRSEVLAAHSAQINGVSGATYTSQGYYRSLEAALAKLHVG